MENAKLHKFLLLQKASEFRTFKGLAEFYCCNLPLLSEYTIINATECDESMNLYSLFSDILNIEEQLYTPFKNGKINIVNVPITFRGLSGGDGIAFTQRSISFDTQTVSYFSKWFKGEVNSLPQNLISILDLLHDGHVDVDYIPYSIENLLFSDANMASVKETIYAFERMYYKKRVPNFYCKYRVNRVINSYNKIRLQTHFEPLRLYYLLYAILLKISIIQLSHNRYSLEHKMNELCEFMHNKLSRILYPEIILAKRYFSKGQEYTFFGKIQKGRKDNMENLKNMAWDLLHLRMLEISFTIKPVKRADANIPYFCTYDKRLLEVKDCYELNSIAINDTSGERFPFYNNIIEIFENIQKYTDSEQLIKRSKECNNINIKEIIVELEKELITL